MVSSRHFVVPSAPSYEAAFVATYVPSSYDTVAKT